MPRKKKQELEILSEEISQTETENQENEDASARGAGDLSENTENQSESDTGEFFSAEEGTEGSGQSENESGYSTEELFSPEDCLEGGTVQLENLKDTEDQSGYGTEGDLSTAEDENAAAGAGDTDFQNGYDTGEENLSSEDTEGTIGSDIRSGYDTEEDLSTAEAGNDAVGARDTDFQSESDTEEEDPEMTEEKASESAVGTIGPGSEKRSGRRERTGTAVTAAPGHPVGRRTGRPAPIRADWGVLSIDGHLVAETDADKARNDLLDLLESQKTGRILTGTIQGVEQPPNDQSRSLAVIYHGDFKVIIPAEEVVEIPDDLRGREPADVLHYMLTKRLGAEVDYIVKGIDQNAGVAAASRLAAMRAKRKEYYLGTDRDGNYRIHSGVCAEARVVSVIRAGIFADIFGLEVYIPLRELSYQRWMDAAGYFQTGQRILVKILSVDRSDRNHIRVTASVKQAGENPYEKALRRYSVGNRYVGTVSMVDTNGVFVALDGGIDCLCSYPKRGRPPRGSRVTVRILGINDESNRIWGAITHIATPH